MTQAPRILAMIGSRVLYGQERSNLLVMEALQAQGCEILAVVEDHPSFRIMPQELEKRGISFIEVPYIGRRVEGYLINFLLGTPIRFLRLRKKLRGVVRDWQPTHIHVPNPFAFLMAHAIAPRGLPIIYRVGDQPSVHNVLWRWIWRRIVNRVTHFVANSQFIARELHVLGVPNERVTVVYNKPAVRSAPPQEKAEPERHHILFIGQITRDKGVDRLVDAFKTLVQEFPQARLTIVGRISDWSGDAWARNLRDKTFADPLIGNRVSFSGETDDIYSYLASASFLVVPSVWQEPLSNVVGEAKIAARPSVVFPSGGLPELIMHGEDGFICRDESVEALGEGLRYYLSHPYRARGHGRAALASLERLEVQRFEERWRMIYDNNRAIGSPDSDIVMSRQRAAAQ
jgi:glycosyltransferase involved in cell wall biosynthesis